MTTFPAFQSMRLDIVTLAMLALAVVASRSAIRIRTHAGVASRQWRFWGASAAALIIVLSRIALLWPSSLTLPLCLGALVAGVLGSFAAERRRTQ